MSEAPLPTVFLHGFLGAPSSWSTVTSHLRDAGELVPMWLPGHGLDPWVPEEARAGADGLVPTTFDTAVDAIARKLPPRARLVGYSMGARVALALAVRHPAKVRSLVAIGVHPGLLGAGEMAARRKWDEDLARDLETKPLTTFVDTWEAQPMFATQRTLAPALRDKRRAERVAHVPRALAWAARSLGLGAMPHFGEALAELALPVHLVTGVLDAKFTEIARHVLGGAPHVSHTAVGSVGHDVALEAPDVVAAIVRSMKDRERGAFTS